MKDVITVTAVLPLFQNFCSTLRCVRMWPRHIVNKLTTHLPITIKTMSTNAKCFNICKKIICSNISNQIMATVTLRDSIYHPDHQTLTTWWIIILTLEQHDWSKLLTNGGDNLVVNSLSWQSKRNGAHLMGFPNTKISCNYQLIKEYQTSPELVELHRLVNMDPLTYADLKTEMAYVVKNGEFLLNSLH